MILLGRWFLLLVLCWGLVGCGGDSGAVVLPTLVSAAGVPAGNNTALPPTWTAQPTAEQPTGTPAGASFLLPPTNTARPIPTSTPFTPAPSRTPTPTQSPTGTTTPVIKSLVAYGLDEIIPFEAFPKPAGNNGWGIHWIPTISQSPAVVDRFIAEVIKMHIKWVVFLNDGGQIGNNDYLVQRLVANGIMPVMRVYRTDITPYDNNLGPMVRHYRAMGVYYFQLYNEPNVNDENRQGFANPNHYATTWADAARIVIANGGLPGFGSLSPGGSYDHLTFLDRTLRAIEFNGDGDVLNRSWLSVHNYHGLRPYDDPGGFLLFREYDAIVRSHLLRSLPMIGTEGGSYSNDPEIEKQFLIYQYSYMREAEPYFFAFSAWLLANLEGESGDPSWEWQSWFRNSFVHPVVTDFFYQNER